MNMYHYIQYLDTIYMYVHIEHKHLAYMRLDTGVLSMFLFYLFVGLFLFYLRGNCLSFFFLWQIPVLTRMYVFYLCSCIFHITLNNTATVIMMFIPGTYYAMHVSLLKKAYKVMNGFILHITCTYVKLAKIILKMFINIRKNVISNSI